MRATRLPRPAAADRLQSFGYRLQLPSMLQVARSRGAAAAGGMRLALPRAPGRALARHASSAAPSYHHAAALPATWPGLATWRASPVDERRWWRGRGPAEHPPAAAEEPSNTSGSAAGCAAACDLAAAEAAAGAAPLAASLAEAARQVLLTSDPRLKASLTHRAWRAYCAGEMPVGVAQGVDAPARPDAPRLVPAREVPTPKQTPLPLNVHTVRARAPGGAWAWRCCRWC